MNWSDFVVLDDDEANQQPTESTSVSFSEGIAVSGPTPTALATDLPPPSSVKRSATESSELVHSSKKSKPSHSGGSEGEAFKSKNDHKKDKVRRAANRQFTLELPKCLSDLDAESSSVFIKSLPTSNDNYKYSEYSQDQLIRANSRLLTQFLSLQRLLLRKMEADSSEVLRSELESKNTELEEANTKISELENKIKNLSVLEENVKSLTLQLQNSEKHHRAELQQQKEEALNHGIQLCRQKHLHIPSEEQVEELQSALANAVTKMTSSEDKLNSLFKKFNSAVDNAQTSLLAAVEKLQPTSAVALPEINELRDSLIMKFGDLSLNLAALFEEKHADHETRLNKVEDYVAGIQIKLNKKRQQKDAEAAAALAQSFSTEKEIEAATATATEQKKRLADERKKKLNELAAKRKSEEEAKKKSEEDTRRKKKLEDSSGLKRSYANKLKKGQIGGGSYQEPILSSTVEIIIKPDKNMVEEWKHILGEWLLAVYVTQAIPITENLDEEFRNWLSIKHSNFYNNLMRVAKVISAIPAAPLQQTMDYKKMEDGSLDKLAFDNTLNKCLIQDNIFEEKTIAEVRKRLYDIFAVPQEEREE